jgi:hypothetical protein
MLWALRKTIGRGMYEKYMATGMPAGKPTMPDSVPPPGGDPAAAVARLRDAAARFKAHAGEIVPSPLFGPLTKEEATRLQLVHAAHHLSFLVPRNG